MPHSSSTLRVVVPARYASSRLPGKPLLDLAGKPMVVRVYEAVRRALPEADIVVAVDDQRVLDALTGHGIQAAMTDPGHESGSDRAAEVARTLGWGGADIVCNVQGDEPLVPQDMLRAFASFCATSTSLSMATIAVPVGTAAEIHDPNVVKLTLDAGDRAIAFSRAPMPFHRELPPAQWPPGDYLRHVGIYAYRNDILQQLTGTPPCTLERIEKLEQLRALWLGLPVHVMRWHQSPPHGVDTPADATRVAALFGEMKP